MATQLEKRLENLEARVIATNARDPILIDLIEWLCGIDGKPFNIEEVPYGVTIGDFLNSCSGRGLPVVHD